MKKIGILTFHYSNNYGGVLQCYALYKMLCSLGFEVEIINYIPSHVKLRSPFYKIGIRKNIFKMKKEDIFPITKVLNRIYIKKKYNKKIIAKFDVFRNEKCKLSKLANDTNLQIMVNEYSDIIVGSDQIWSPGERNHAVYFLDYDNYKGKRISYAADSTISEIEDSQINKLSSALEKFNSISVRNEHSFNFVEQLTQEKVQIVSDPTLLWDFDEITEVKKLKNNYILVYVLGKEILESNKNLIEKIKREYGDLKVYSIIIPTMKFNLNDYSDEFFYDLSPSEWLDMFRNATFIITDSFHGTLFSLKFRKLFIAYYTEKIRSTRFIDMGKRYMIEDFIVNSIDEMNEKNSLKKKPNFEAIHEIINQQKEESKKYLIEALK